METRWRKLRVGFISVIAVLAVYLLYSQVMSTPRIKVSRLEPDAALTDANQQDLSEQVTQVGDIGLGDLRVAEYVTLDPKTKQVARKFGFERLLHEEAGQWEVEKPYLNIYRPDLTCFITADKGFVIPKSDVSPPDPRNADGTLVGDVVAHIVPQPGSDIEECKIFLNDLTFLSSKSQFSSAGPVRFESQNAHMKADGLELVYDDAKNRLALLRIVDLHELNLNVLQKLSLARQQSDDTAQPEGTRHAAQGRKEPNPQYQCVLNKNVRIETPEQLVAADQVRLNDIIWSDSVSDSPDKTPAAGANEMPADTSRADSADQQPADNTPSGERIPLKVTCDDGIVVVPEDLQTLPANIKALVHKELPTGAPAELTDTAPGRTTFAAKRIDYSTNTSDAVATGMSRLRFYVKDVIGADSTQAVIPVTVVSEKEARFSPQSNRITFEGNCTCRMIRTDGEIDQQYRLFAPQIVVDLADQGTSGSDLIADIRRLWALGTTESMARLASLKRRGSDFLGGIELKCPQFEYDTARQLFVAQGRGVIKADNSKIPPPAKKVGRFSLQRPCYAVVQNFDRLEYHLASELIVADNKSERITIDYFPITDRGTESVSVTAGRIEAELVRTETGQRRLWTLLANQGISYQEPDKLFEGTAFLYDDQKQLITAKGDPAYFNGALFDGLEYDLVSGQVRKAQISRGLFQITR